MSMRTPPRSSGSGLGQSLGPLVGGALVGVRTELPFLIAGTLLVGIGATVHRAVSSKDRRSPSERQVGAVNNDLLGTLVPTG
jgi:hypothetical protein